MEVIPRLLSLLLLEVELMETALLPSPKQYDSILSLLLLEVELMETLDIRLSSGLLYALNRFYYWKWN